MKAEEKYYVTVKIKSEIVGVFISALAFLFGKQENSTEFFHIVRVLEINCEDQTTRESGPVEPYDPRRRFIVIPIASEFEKGRPLDKLNQQMYRLKALHPLPEIYIPNELYTVIKILENTNRCERVPKDLKQIADSVKRVLGHNLEWLRYGPLMKTLLKFEKVQMDQDIRKYDMKNVTMRLNSSMMELSVPGLEENRPSVLRGDKIFVRIVDEYNAKIDVEYEGVVHRVESTKVILGFNPKFIRKHVDGMKYHVRFTYSLLPLKHMILAVDNARVNGLGNLLFPTNDTAAQCALVRDPSIPLRFFNRCVDDNPEQQLAIKQIVLGASLPAPFLLFGPPGTGKTMTVVEAIKQVWSLFPSARMLICTPSNSAADLIGERLLQHVDCKDILRFYSASRPWEKVPQLLKDKDVVNYDTTRKSYFYPSVKEISAFKIVISTLVNSGRLCLADFPKNHFTHIFIDESGHSVEPEALIPISVLLQCKDQNSTSLGGQLVLAGDPKQLGPTIRSKVAESNGLGISILRRLMESCEVYKKSSDGYNSNVLAKLVKNYRSHPAILKLPNLLFYDNELQVCADKLLRESLCSWEYLPKKGFPIIFHGVIGKDQREGKSPSYFNPQEVSVVIDYVDKLLNSRKYGVKVNAKDIGVITPYRQQVYKIQQQLKKKKLQSVSAGSVDEFQGQERKAIVISTVRSNTQLMALDSEFRLGFVQNPERFNVAITRAKALLIVVGNPKVLSKDFRWRCLLEYCLENNSYTGVRYQKPKDEAQDLIDRFAHLFMGTDDDDGTYRMPFSHRAQQEDPRWRGEM